LQHGTLPFDDGSHTLADLNAYHNPDNGISHYCLANSGSL
jgi:hypothetical protein